MTAQARKHWPPLSQPIFTAIAYFLTAKLSLALMPGIGLPFWPAAGIGLAAIMLWGRRCWVGIAIGGWLISYQIHGLVGAALLSTTGQTVEVLAIGWLLRKRFGFHPEFSRLRDIICLLGCTMFFALPGSALGLLGYLWGDTFPAANFLNHWFSWWLGDVLGILLITPLILIHAKLPLPEIPRLVWRESPFYLLMLALTAGSFMAPSTHFETQYLPLVALLYPALTQDSRRTIISMTLVTFTAVYFTAVGQGPFILAGGMSHLAMFLVITISTMLLLAARSQEQRSSAKSLSTAIDQWTSMVANLPGAVWTADNHGNTLFISDHVAEITGYTPAEIITGGGTFLASRRHPMDALVLWAQYSDLFKTPGINTLDFRFRHRNGNWRWLKLRCTATREIEGVKVADGLLYDITEQKQQDSTLQRLLEEKTLLEDKLRFSLIEKEAILDNMLAGVAFTRDRVFQWTNPAIETMLGYSSGELKGQSTRILYPSEESWRDVGERSRRCFSAGQPFIGEIEYRHKNGHPVPLLVYYNRIERSRRENEFVVVCLDISDRRQLEREITNLGEQQLRHLGMELHDNLGQQLTGIALLAKTLENILDKQQAEGANHAANLANHLQQAISTVRMLAHGLHPLYIEHHDLAGSLQHLAKQTEQTSGMTCLVEFPAILPNLPVESVLHLYRIAQEAVNNAVKHSQATQIAIAIEARSNQFSMAISDNGLGIAGDVSTSEGIGHRMMRHRASLIGATFSVASQSEAGVRVAINLPL